MLLQSILQSHTGTRNVTGGWICPSQPICNSTGQDGTKTFLTTPTPPPPVWQLTTFPLHNHLLVPLGAGAVSGVSLPFLWQPLPEESIES